MMINVPSRTVSSLPSSIILLLLSVIVRFSPVSSSAHCNQACGSMHIPYPFGITPGCGLDKYNLTCGLNWTLTLSFKSHNYKVVNFTPNSTIIIDPEISDFSLFDYHLGDTYVPSVRNHLILSSCKNRTNCPNTSFLDYFFKIQCNMTSSCCYDLQVSDPSSRYKNLTNLGCSSYSSWVNSVIPPQNGEQVRTVQATYGLELEWAIPGRCSTLPCGANATCLNGTAGAFIGYTCKCNDNYTGDPYSACNPYTNQAPCNTTSMTNGCACSLNGDANCQSSTPTLKVTHRALVVAGIVAGATVAAALILAFAVIKRRSFLTSDRRSRFDMRQIAKLLTLKGTATNVKIFAYKDLEKATKGFSNTEMLGHGAHGTVYAGKLQDGHAVAVKRINNISKQAIEVVMNELMVLSAVSHKNLVRLLGCCLEVRDPLLVYEFVPNGTLSEHLQRERGEGLDWYTRISIASEAAQALAYLHSAVDPPIYHRDVKSSNILLDFEYCTKVADFGISKLVVTEGSHISTVPQGTPGYLDPEYHQNFHLSDKSDVYSFGVVLVEIITAMKVVDFSRDCREINLAALALAKITNGNLEEIIDPFLEANKNPLTLAMVQRVAELAFTCLSYDKDARPTMAQVAEELENIRLSSISQGGDQSPIKDNSLFMGKVGFYF
ncbi:hypothetical protein O6H91_13G000600 [Diphasiastrum complanatum]|uniref:Uncharacterized protein n=1 Tax=Diphasiastrum complanatum TaxID=34168 RepID=A0ACC2BRB6_DIPCM|nr:hypothetical protein O6H91_13G000600 [Diphasiastrum complanatum]